MLESQCIKEIKKRLTVGLKSCSDIDCVESDVVAAHNSLSETQCYDKGEDNGVWPGK